MEVFELVGAEPRCDRRLQAAAARGLTPLRRAASGDGRLCTGAGAGAGAGTARSWRSSGEAGVGKSRLVYEFVHSHRTQGWLVLESASVSYGKATPYFPVIDLLKRYFHIEDRDDTRTIRAKVTGQVLTLDRALQDDAPGAAGAPGRARRGQPDLQASIPPQRRQRTLDALKRVLLRESQVQPLLLVFEDLHWIDAETQALLDSLVESLPTARLLLLVNYRPEYQHGWGSKTYYTQLRLDPLPPRAPRSCSRPCSGTTRAWRRSSRCLIARTEGNPFFLEESVRTLVETGVLVGERGRLSPGAGRSRACRCPPPCRPCWRPASTGLPPEDKRLLQAAAVDRHGRALPAAAGHCRAARGGAASTASATSRPPSSSTRRGSSPSSNTPSSTP